MFPFYRKIKFLFFGLSGLMVTLGIFSFSTEESYYDIPFKVNRQLLDKYSLELQSSVLKLDVAASEFKFGKIALDSLRRELSNTRISYKKARIIRD